MKKKPAPFRMEFFYLLFFCALVPTIVCASVYTVTSASDNGGGSLRNIMDLLWKSGDTIQFDIPQTDTIVLDSSLYFNLQTYFDGRNRATGNRIVITVPEPGKSTFRLFRKYMNVRYISKRTTFKDLILHGGSASPGAVVNIYSDNSDTTIFENTSILDGAATVETPDHGDSFEAEGGGVYSYGGNLVFINCDISNNSAFARGTGEDVRSGAVIARGGAVCVTSGGDIFMRNCTVGKNSANAHMIFQGGSGYAEAKGGAIYTYEGFVTIENSAFFNNSVYACDSSTDITLPWVESVGGGIYNYDGRLFIKNSTMFGNTADDNRRESMGGAIYAIYTRTIISGSTIIENSARSGSGLYSGMANIINSIILNGNSDLLSCLRILYSVAGSIPDATYPPQHLDTLSDYLSLFGTEEPEPSDNGGLTRTIALVSGAQSAIEAGSPIRIVQSDTTVEDIVKRKYGIAYPDSTGQWVYLESDEPVPETVEYITDSTDQRGYLRNVDAPCIGAYEYDGIVSMRTAPVSSLAPALSISKKHMTLTCAAPMQTSVEFYSLSGKRVFCSSHELVAGDNRISFPELATGIYILKLGLPQRDYSRSVYIR